MKILIMGLPGAGKTTLALNLIGLLGPDVLWLNADDIRNRYNDWDFSHAGRIRQSQRMQEIADSSDKKYIVADFVCPLPEMREIYNADFTIWVDTIKQGRFEDTNKVFIEPETYDVRVTEQDAGKWAKDIINKYILLADK